MHKIKNILNYDRRFYPFLFFSITLIFFGFFIITDSIFFISLSGNNNKINEIQTVSILKPTFVYREDVSLNIDKNKNLKPTFFYREDVSLNIDKNMKTTKITPSSRFVDFNNFDLKKNTLTKETSILALKTLPKELYSGAKKSKKAKFIVAILPLVINQNEKIRKDRLKLLKINNFLNVYKTLNKEDQLFLEKMAKKYNIDTKNET